MPKVPLSNIFIPSKLNKQIWVTEDICLFTNIASDCKKEAYPSEWKFLVKLQY